jgi:hypothetical protein
MLKKCMRWPLTFVVLLVSLSTLAATMEGDMPRVDWNAAALIDWSLFQGTPPLDASQRTEAAAIHMTIRWRASYSVSSIDGSSWAGRIASISVTNTMEPAYSWVVPGKAFDDVLTHEQLHFDLNEVYRRKLECLLLATSACSNTSQQGAVDSLNSVLHQTAEVVLQKLSDMQTLYDSQTSHSSNRAEQARWQSLITAWLAAPSTAP